MQLGAYDPASNTFSILSGAVPDNSRSIAFDTKNDLYVSVAGGRTSAYDPETGKWTSLNISAPDIAGAMLVYDSVNDVVVAKARGNSPEPLYLLRLDLGKTRVRQARSRRMRSSVRLSALPNPFKSSVKIAISGQHSGISELSVYNIAGKRLYKQTADSRQLKAGISWNATGHPSGLYIVRVLAGPRVLTKNIFLSR
jgi:hypothetical protein